MKESLFSSKANKNAEKRDWIKNACVNGFGAKRLESDKQFSDRLFISIQFNLPEDRFLCGFSFIDHQKSFTYGVSFFRILLVRIYRADLFSSCSPLFLLSHFLAIPSTLFLYFFSRSFENPIRRMVRNFFW